MAGDAGHRDSNISHSFRIVSSENQTAGTILILRRQPVANLARVFVWLLWHLILGTDMHGSPDACALFACVS
uniref:Uncharacterized protein n=1 Tax=Oryza meridionalis TaxID=40149 RepID=A0A0E0CV85_9ORYZ